MIAAQPAPSPAEAAPQPATDPAVARAELRLTKLARLSDKQLAALDAVKDDGSPASAESIAKLSRAVRLTLILEETLDNALTARLAGETPKTHTPRDCGGRRAASQGAAKDADAEGEGEDFFAELKTGRKARVRELMVDVIDREIPDRFDHDDVTDALEERLLCDEAYETLEDLPLLDIVERLCADLGLNPDWSRWTGEGWAPNPPFWRPLCSDFAAPSRVRILADPPDLDPRE